MFYVQPTDEIGKTIFFIDKIWNYWDPLSKAANAALKESNAVPQFKELKDKMFSVFDGNHQLQVLA